MKAMKALFVLVVAAVLTGCHANSAPGPKWYEEWIHADYGRCPECGQVWKRPKWSVGFGADCAYCDGPVHWESLGDANYQRYKNWHGDC
jgi:hypothetical protein